ncbi:DUF302 domain-containing protein [Picrophilus oshimae]|uniref:DUF302 domain-containing protein n=1 Tax=Picrophilus torridus (strain ATCC 700027 / DSM 9790 / JCM 10055 / NBRC 100828 / KAW 2/3) TaxID=1122961 RepID=Q6KZV7_PICTO|nr:DUF302 domain-containing protein [Picrophilus oshimae]AAT43745.1 hypothetical protein PTO1160 [Picrophilus oshimae DSM 9789]
MYAYEKVVDSGADQLFSRIYKKLKDENWVVVSYVDISEMMKKQYNITMEPYYIMDVCYPPAARELLDDNYDIGAFIPCKVILAQRDKKTKVIIPRPSVLSREFLNSSGKIAEKYEDIIINLVDAEIK